MLAAGGISSGQLKNAVFALQKQNFPYFLGIMHNMLNGMPTFIQKYGAWIASAILLLATIAAAAQQPDVYLDKTTKILYSHAPSSYSDGSGTPFSVGQYAAATGGTNNNDLGTAGEDRAHPISGGNTYFFDLNNVLSDKLVNNQVVPATFDYSRPFVGFHESGFTSNRVRVAGIQSGSPKLAAVGIDSNGVRTYGVNVSDMRNIYGEIPSPNEISVQWRTRFQSGFTRDLPSGSLYLNDNPDIITITTAGQSRTFQRTVIAVISDRAGLMGNTELILSQALVFVTASAAVVNVNPLLTVTLSTNLFISSPEFYNIQPFGGAVVRQYPLSVGGDFTNLINSASNNGAVYYADYHAVLNHRFDYSRPWISFYGNNITEIGRIETNRRRISGIRSGGTIGIGIVQNDNIGIRVSVNTSNLRNVRGNAPIPSEVSVVWLNNFGGTLHSGIGALTLTTRSLFGNTITLQAVVYDRGALTPPRSQFITLTATPDNRAVKVDTERKILRSIPDSFIGALGSTRVRRSSNPNYLGGDVVLLNIRPVLNPIFELEFDFHAYTSTLTTAFDYNRPFFYFHDPAGAGIVESFRARLYGIQSGSPKIVTLSTSITTSDDVVPQVIRTDFYSVDISNLRDIYNDPVPTAAINVAWYAIAISNAVTVSTILDNIAFTRQESVFGTLAVVVYDRSALAAPNTITIVRQANNISSPSVTFNITNRILRSSPAAYADNAFVAVGNYRLPNYSAPNANITAQAANDGSTYIFDVGTVLGKDFDYSRPFLDFNTPGYSSYRVRVAGITTGAPVLMTTAPLVYSLDISAMRNMYDEVVSPYELSVQWQQIVNDQIEPVAAGVGLISYDYTQNAPNENILRVMVSDRAALAPPTVFYITNTIAEAAIAFDKSTRFIRSSRAARRKRSLMRIGNYAAATGPRSENNARIAHRAPQNDNVYLFGIYPIWRETFDFSRPFFNFNQGPQLFNSQRVRVAGIESGTASLLEVQPNALYTVDISNLRNIYGVAPEFFEISIQWRLVNGGSAADIAPANILAQALATVEATTFNTNGDAIVGTSTITINTSGILGISPTLPGDLRAIVHDRAGLAQPQTLNLSRLNISNRSITLVLDKPSKIIRSNTHPASIYLRAGAYATALENQFNADIQAIVPYNTAVQVFSLNLAAILADNFNYSRPFIDFNNTSTGSERVRIAGLESGNASIAQATGAFANRRYTVNISQLRDIYGDTPSPQAVSVAWFNPSLDIGYRTTTRVAVLTQTFAVLNSTNKITLYSLQFSNPTSTVTVLRGLGSGIGQLEALVHHTLTGTILAVVHDRASLANPQTLNIVRAATTAPVSVISITLDKSNKIVRSNALPSNYPLTIGFHQSASGGFEFFTNPSGIGLSYNPTARDFFVNLANVIGADFDYSRPFIDFSHQILERNDFYRSNRLRIAGLESGNATISGDPIRNEYVVDISGLRDIYGDAPLPQAVSVAWQAIISATIKGTATTFITPLPSGDLGQMTITYNYTPILATIVTISINAGITTVIPIATITNAIPNTIRAIVYDIAALANPQTLNIALADPLEIQLDNNIVYANPNLINVFSTNGIPQIGQYRTALAPEAPNADYADFIPAVRGQAQLDLQSGLPTDFDFTKPFIDFNDGTERTNRLRVAGIQSGVPSLGVDALIGLQFTIDISNLRNVLGLVPQPQALSVQWRQVVGGTTTTLSVFGLPLGFGPADGVGSLTALISPDTQILGGSIIAIVHDRSGMANPRTIQVATKRNPYALSLNTNTKIVRSQAALVAHFSSTLFSSNLPRRAGQYETNLPISTATNFNSDIATSVPLVGGVLEFNLTPMLGASFDYAKPFIDFNTGEAGSELLRVAGIAQGAAVTIATGRAYSFDTSNMRNIYGEPVQPYELTVEWTRLGATASVYQVLVTNILVIDTPRIFTFTSDIFTTISVYRRITVTIGGSTHVAISVSLELNKIGDRVVKFTITNAITQTIISDLSRTISIVGQGFVTLAVGNGAMSYTPPFGTQQLRAVIADRASLSAPQIFTVNLSNAATLSINTAQNRIYMHNRTDASALQASIYFQDRVALGGKDLGAAVLDSALGLYYINNPFTAGSAFDYTHPFVRFINTDSTRGFTSPPLRIAGIMSGAARLDASFADGGRVYSFDISDMRNIYDAAPENYELTVEWRRIANNTFTTLTVGHGEVSLSTNLLAQTLQGVITDRAFLSEPQTFNLELANAANALYLNATQKRFYMVATLDAADATPVAYHFSNTTDTSGGTVLGNGVYDTAFTTYYINAASFLGPTFNYDWPYARLVDSAANGITTDAARVAGIQSGAISVDSDTFRRYTVDLSNLLNIYGDVPIPQEMHFEWQRIADNITTTLAMGNAVTAYALTTFLPGSLRIVASDRASLTEPQTLTMPYISANSVTYDIPTKIFQLVVPFSVNASVNLYQNASGVLANPSIVVAAADIQTNAQQQQFVDFNDVLGADFNYDYPFAVFHHSSGLSSNDNRIRIAGIKADTSAVLSTTQNSGEWDISNLSNIYGEDAQPYELTVEWLSVDSSDNVLSTLAKGIGALSYTHTAVAAATVRSVLRDRAGLLPPQSRTFTVSLFLVLDVTNKQVSGLPASSTPTSPHQYAQLDGGTGVALSELSASTINQREVYDLTPILNETFKYHLPFIGFVRNNNEAIGRIRIAGIKSGRAALRTTQNSGTWDISNLQNIYDEVPQPYELTVQWLSVDASDNVLSTLAQGISVISYTHTAIAAATIRTVLRDRAGLLPPQSRTFTASIVLMLDVTNKQVSGLPTSSTPTSPHQYAQLDGGTGVALSELSASTINQREVYNLTPILNETFKYHLPFIGFVRNGNEAIGRIRVAGIKANTGALAILRATQNSGEWDISNLRNIYDDNAQPHELTVEWLSVDSSDNVLSTLATGIGALSYTHTATAAATIRTVLRDRAGLSPPQSRTFTVSIPLILDVTNKLLRGLPTSGARASIYQYAQLVDGASVSLSLSASIINQREVYDLNQILNENFKYHLPFIGFVRNGNEVGNRVRIAGISSGTAQMNGKNRDFTVNIAGLRNIYTDAVQPYEVSVVWQHTAPLTTSDTVTRLTSGIGLLSFTAPINVASLEAVLYDRAALANPQTIIAAGIVPPPNAPASGLSIQFDDIAYTVAGAKLTANIDNVQDANNNGIVTASVRNYVWERRSNSSQPFTMVATGANVSVHTVQDLTNISAGQPPLFRLIVDYIDSIGYTNRITAVAAINIVNQPPTGLIIQFRDVEYETPSVILTADTTNVTDPNGNVTATFSTMVWQIRANNTANFVNLTSGVSLATYTITRADFQNVIAGQRPIFRLLADYTDDLGFSSQVITEVSVNLKAIDPLFADVVVTTATLNAYSGSLLIHRSTSTGSATLYQWQRSQNQTDFTDINNATTLTFDANPQNERYLRLRIRYTDSRGFIHELFSPVVLVNLPLADVSRPHVEFAVNVLNVLEAQAAANAIGSQLGNIGNINNTRQQLLEINDRAVTAPEELAAALAQRTPKSQNAGKQFAFDSFAWQQNGGNRGGKYKWSAWMRGSWAELESEAEYPHQYEGESFGLYGGYDQNFGWGRLGFAVGFSEVELLADLSNTGALDDEINRQMRSIIPYVRFGDMDSYVRLYGGFGSGDVEIRTSNCNAKLGANVIYGGLSSELNLFSSGNFQTAANGNLSYSKGGIGSGQCKDNSAVFPEINGNTGEWQTGGRVSYRVDNDNLIIVPHLGGEARRYFGDFKDNVAYDVVAGFSVGNDGASNNTFSIEGRRQVNKTAHSRQNINLQFSYQRGAYTASVRSLYDKNQPSQRWTITYRDKDYMDIWGSEWYIERATNKSSFGSNWSITF